MPVRGFIVWNNHAFNLTTTATSVEQWLNVEFASPEQQRHRRVQIFDASEIFVTKILELADDMTKEGGLHGT